MCIEMNIFVNEIINFVSCDTNRKLCMKYKSICIHVGLGVYACVLKMFCVC